ncbi:hypothetical protein [Caproicibacterium sp. BJN0003]|uniref:hypothetical protein n=1 Tax=Caproicibacterium sp. BJN0003 TaxID=2994078 RepID=UPI00224DF337|nr:hypothetical protein [Caproicibacterium sp. BJN0003]UZT82114.1 hypothetical protein OP489_11710 [Caproicibacterium sp. BJN0003]
MKINGSKLKFQMAIHNLTQTKLSKKSGLSTYTVFNALNSKNVRPMTERLLSRAIGIEEGKILEEEKKC